MKKTILLAEDSVTIQRLVADTFAGDDFDVVPVRNGDDAVSSLKKIHPAAILADVGLPEMDGYELCRFVKRDPVLTETPVVLLVGAFEEFDSERASAVGADAHIEKPFEPQALLELVSDAIRGVAPAGDEADSSEDILGLGRLFPARASTAPERPRLSESEIVAIADRVMMRLSREVVERVAWDVVPDIAERVVREEIDRQD